MDTLRIPVLVLLLAATGLAEDDVVPRSRLAEFKQRLAAASVARRASAAKFLDLDDPRAADLAYAMFEDRHWYVRGAGIRAVASIDDAATRAKMRLDLLTDKRAMVREGIAAAIGLTPEVGDAKALVGALSDEHWTVRRAAARSLGEITSREAISALIDRLDGSEHPRVRIWAAWSLRSLTGQKQLGQNQRRWRAWWDAHEDDPALEPLKDGAEVKRRDFGGVELEFVTVTRGGRPGPDLIVIGRYGYRDEYLRPYLDELSSRVRVTYVRLPSLEELTGVSGYEGEGAIPRYPVEKLVKAFDLLRKELGKKKVAILAHGATGWMALRYAQRYPDRTRALVLVNSWLDAKSYTISLFNMSMRGTDAEKFVADSLTNRNRVPKSPAAYRAISLIMLTSSFTDHADLAAAFIYWSSYEPQGFSVVPDVRWPAGSELDTPVLFLFSLDHPLSGHLSMVRIREHLPNAIVAVMRRSRGHPYIEEPKEFLRVFDGFLSRHRLR